MDNCYFCNNEETTLFHEHYTFCPNCSAIYTNLMIQESSCDHVKDGVPVTLREPWYEENRNVPFIKEKGDEQECSVCGKSCIADGW
jgi:hypothetical protein